MPLLLIIVTLTLTLTLTQVEPAAGAVMAAMLRVSREHELHAVEDRSVPVSDAEVQVRERDRETERERETLAPQRWPHTSSVRAQAGGLDRAKPRGAGRSLTTHAPRAASMW
jgi:hypothetical protein